jgi:hypothetical protein
LTLQGSDYAHAVHELKRRLIERKGFGDDGPCRYLVALLISFLLALPAMSVERTRGLF